MPHERLHVSGDGGSPVDIRGATLRQIAFNDVDLQVGVAYVPAKPTRAIRAKCIAEPSVERDGEATDDRHNALIPGGGWPTVSADLAGRCAEDAIVERPESSDVKALLYS